MIAGLENPPQSLVAEFGQSGVKCNVWHYSLQGQIGSRGPCWLRCAARRLAVDVPRSWRWTRILVSTPSAEIWPGITFTAAVGCDAAQGFYLSRPVTAAAFVEWLRDSPWGSQLGPG